MAKKKGGRRRGEDSAKIREERAKLSASFVSSIGVGVIVIGVARPFLDPGLNRKLVEPAAPGDLSALSTSIDLLVIAISMVVGFICHMVGRWLLRRMAAPKAPEVEE